MGDLTLFMLLIVAIALGAFFGRIGWGWPHRRQQDSLTQDYFVGLNYLLDDKTDAAIGAFIRALEVNSETLETYLALGRLLRRRGEVEQAINIHQDLLARPDLSNTHSVAVRYELARDYMVAGLLDRAERLLQELVNESGDLRWASLELIVDLYRIEKEWEKAIEYALILTQKRSGRFQRRDPAVQNRMQPALAHFCCELAQQAMTKGDYNIGNKKLTQGLGFHWKCVRISLLQGELQYKLGNYQEAIRSFQRIREQDPDFIPESLEQLKQCYEAIDEQRGFETYLNRCIEERPSISLFAAQAELIRREQGETPALDFLTLNLRQHPSVRGGAFLLEFINDYVEGPAVESINILKGILTQLRETHPIYRCEHCGYSGKFLHWLCPSCNQWGTVKPIFGLIGE